MFTLKVNNDETVYFAQGYNSSNPKKIQLAEINIPLSHYYLPSPLNTITIINETTAASEVLTLTEAFYSNPTDFITQLKTDLNNNTINLIFSVTYDKYTRKITISTVAKIFTITASQYVLKVFGMQNNATLSGALTYTSADIINLNIFDGYYITIYINNLAILKNLIYENGTYTQDTLNLYGRQGSIFGEYQEYDFKEDNILLVDAMNTLTVSSFKIVIKNYAGYVFDFNGQNLFLTLNYIY